MSHTARGPSQLTRQMLARAAIRERRLPNRLPERASGGVHLRCFSVWENELMKGASSASLP